MALTESRVGMKKAVWTRCTPAVPRYWLWLSAGLLWSGVGIGLCIAALHWLSPLGWPQGIGFAILGAGAGAIIYRFGFSKIARKNIDRISGKPDPVCFFAFQAWRSYGLIIGMMLLGFILRHSPVPRSAVALIYLAIGAALSLSSSLYYDRLL